MTSAKAAPDTALRTAPRRAGLLTTRPSLMQVAADEMRRMILSGRLVPGERLRAEITSRFARYEGKRVPVRTKKHMVLPV